MMDRKGWNNFIWIDGTEKMNKVSANGAEFLVTPNEAWLNKDFTQPYLQEPLGKFEHLHLYRLSPQPQSKKSAIQFESRFLIMGITGYPVGSSLRPSACSAKRPSLRACTWS